MAAKFQVGLFTLVRKFSHMGFMSLVKYERTLRKRYVKFPWGQTPGFFRRVDFAIAEEDWRITLNCYPWITHDHKSLQKGRSHLCLCLDVFSLDVGFSWPLDSNGSCRSQRDEHEILNLLNTNSLVRLVTCQISFSLCHDLQSNFDKWTYCPLACGMACKAFRWNF